MPGQPDSIQAWRDVASERSSDVLSLDQAQRSVAAVYLLGYVIECYAKAMCLFSGVGVPRGQAGHDLVQLLEKSGYRRNDLPPDLREFADTRDVSLRYQAALPEASMLKNRCVVAERWHVGLFAGLIGADRGGR